MPAAELPHAVDAERAVLGALLVDNGLFADVDGVLKGDFFYDKRHKLLFRTMEEIYAGGYVDPIVLAKRLADGGSLPEAGGNEYIAEIADIGAAPVNMAAYIELIRNTSAVRDMIHSLNDSIGEAYRPAGKAPMKLLDEAAVRLSEISENFTRGEAGVKDVKTLALAYFDKMSEVVKTKNFDSLLGASTGFDRLDYLTGGLNKGDLIVLAGRPGAGKTAFGLNLVRHISGLPNTGVICFSLEMSAEQLVMRLLSHAGIDMHKLRVGRGLTWENMAALSQSASALENHEIFIDESGMLNILEARARARRLKLDMQRRGVKLGLIFVDYLQLMDAAPGDKGDSRVQEVSGISRGLKALAKELDAPVLAASQLNRSVETRQVKQPMLSDLRESGAIEQDADLILFLYKKEEGAPADGQEDSYTVRLSIGKQRNGPLGGVDLDFRVRHSLFREIAHPDSRAAAVAAHAGQF